MRTSARVYATKRPCRKAGFRGYWTVRFKVTGRTAPPELAVTVRVKFDGVGRVPLPPPPHATVRQSASSRDASAAWTNRGAKLARFVRRFLARTIPTSDREHTIPDASLSDAEPSGVKRIDGTRSAVADGMAVTVTGTAADPLT